MIEKLTPREVLRRAGKRVPPEPKYVNVDASRNAMLARMEIDVKLALLDSVEDPVMRLKVMRGVPNAEIEASMAERARLEATIERIRHTYNVEIPNSEDPLVPPGYGV